MARTKDTKKIDIVREFIKKFPNTSNHELARLICKKYPADFHSVEQARLKVRYALGSAGNTKRHTMGNKEMVIPHKSQTPYNLPDPDSEDLEPYKLPLSFNNFILAGDFHVPNHRKPPIEAMMAYAKKNKITKMILNGDLLDNTPFTRWMREPLDKKDVKRWFDMAESLLRYFKTQFNEIYWLEGNHDFWYKRYLMQKAPELFGDSYYDLENRLHLNDIGVKFISQNYLVKAGYLNITHGHILFRGGGSYANAARMLYMKTKTNIIASHVHVESSHTEPDLDDKVVTCFTTGSMCTLRPEYQPFGGKSCHGFAHITVQPNKHFNVKNFRIYKGEIL